MKCVIVEKDVMMEWVDGNFGLKLIMKYLVIWLMGDGVYGEVLLIVFVGKG